MELVGPGLFQPALWHALPVLLQPQLQLRLSSASFPQSALWPPLPGPSHSGSVSYARAQNSALSFLKEHGALRVWGGRAQPLFSLNAGSQHTRPYPQKGHRGENLMGKANQVFRGFQKGQLTRYHP